MSDTILPIAKMNVIMSFLGAFREIKKRHKMGSKLRTWENINSCDDNQNITFDFIIYRNATFEYFLIFFFFLKFGTLAFERFDKFFFNKSLFNVSFDLDNRSTSSWLNLNIIKHKRNRMIDV